MATEDDKDELLLSCRYGELDEVKQFVEKYGSQPLQDIRDQNGNTILHMTCGNGHEDILDYLLPLIDTSFLSSTNNAGSTPLHWATLNSHLSIVKILVLFPQGPGAALIDIKNSAGRSPLGEAEMAGWDEGAQWLTSQMNLDDGAENTGMKEEDTIGEDLEAGVGEIEVEIEDADGGIAKMTLGPTKDK
ncbi:ankyrin repeat-containing domain protein [Hysterangium stoloniferum]|nr:ankyrin repeat-containing domain protein [Hysterangium stoloniferum]